MHRYSVSCPWNLHIFTKLNKYKQYLRKVEKSARHILGVSIYNVITIFGLVISSGGALALPINKTLLLRPLRPLCEVDKIYTHGRSHPFSRNGGWSRGLGRQQRRLPQSHILICGGRGTDKHRTHNPSGKEQGRHACDTLWTALPCRW